MIKIRFYIVLFLISGFSWPSPAQTHITLLCGDNGSQITGSVTTLNLTGNVYVYSEGSGASGAVIEIPVGLGDVTRTFYVQNSNAEADLTVSDAISGTPGIVKLENGNLRLEGASLYQDATTISGGMLQLGAANAVPANPLVLNGGVYNSGSPAGNSNILGYLKLTENSTISLGAGNHTISFAASDDQTWAPAKTLTITGWQGDYDGTNGAAGQIFFGRRPA
jgi:autotransporter-associated beta strand protein